MALTIYATAADLTDGEWVSQAPANADRLLRSASFAVADACMRNPYSDVPTGDDADALRDATCAQVASWVALGIDPAKVGTDVVAPVKKSNILDGNVERDTSAQAKAAVDAAKDLCREAIDILTASGLIYQPVPVGASPSDPLPQWGQGRRWWFGAESLSGEWEWPLGGDWPFE